MNSGPFKIIIQVVWGLTNACQVVWGVVFGMLVINTLAGVTGSDAF